MPRLKGAAAVLTAAETARQWARSNPDQAEAYIDKAVGFIDRRTGGKYHSKVTGLSGHAKKALTGRSAVGGATTGGETVSGETVPEEPRRRFPDASH